MKKITILIVYVDDIIITRDEHKGKEDLKKLLAREFEIKDLGNLRYFLEIKVARSKAGISISHREHVLDLLKETDMFGHKPTKTSMDHLNKQGKERNTLVDKERYRWLVGKLIYLSHTRPDIGFAMSMMSRFMNNPTQQHLNATYKTLQYLKSRPGEGLYFKISQTREVEAFTDVD